MPVIVQNLAAAALIFNQQSAEHHGRQAERSAQELRQTWRSLEKYYMISFLFDQLFS